MNDFCDYYNIYKSFKMSTKFNLDLVTNNIDSDKPLTLGGLIFADGGGGHSVVIHGYDLVYYPTHLVCTLYLNDSWGKNNHLVSMDVLNVNENQWSDHIYYS